jgi:hypothetical protein
MTTISSPFITLKIKFNLLFFNSSTDQGDSVKKLSNPSAFSNPTTLAGAQALLQAVRG